MSDSAPASISSGTNGAVYGGQTGPADIDQAGGLSAYGTMAQSGNVWEWNETAFDLNNNDPGEGRILRGGSWGDTFSGDPYITSSDLLSATTSENWSYAFGFRVAMIPEPSSLSLLVAGGAVLMAGRRRK
jgi:formylglycine-generating enzyme required for sulfatase activity